MAFILPLVGFPQAPALPTGATNAKDPPMVPGIYAIVGTDAPVELLPTLSHRTRLKGVFGMAFSFGIAHARALGYLKGERAMTRLSGTTTFRFRFAANASAFGRDVHLQSSTPIAASPSEFMLVRTDRQQGDRVFQYGRYGLATAETGATEEQNVPFTVARISADLFEVTVPTLLPGEYAWVWLGDLAHTGGPVRVHEFGVDP